MVSIMSGDDHTLEEMRIILSKLQVKFIKQDTFASFDSSLVKYGTRFLHMWEACILQAC